MRQNGVSAFLWKSSRLLLNSSWYIVEALCIYGTAVLVGRSRDRFPVVSLGIFSVPPSDGTMCPGVESALENGYQGFVLG